MSNPKSGEIVCAPIGCVRGWSACVVGFEERYGTSYGETEGEARAAMIEWIEHVDDGVDTDPVVRLGMEGVKA